MNPITLTTVAEPLIRQALAEDITNEDVSTAAIMPVVPTGIPACSSIRAISRSQSITSWALSVLGRRTTWTPARTTASRSWTPRPLDRSLIRTTVSFEPKCRV